jgi:hypothetical protein
MVVMTEEIKFEPGQCYFMLGYCDRDLRIPDIETYIFLGRNVFGPQSEDLWYFQEARSFVEHGRVKTTSDPNYEHVMGIAKDALSSFVDWRGLIEELTENKKMQEQGKTLAQRVL